jgi:hypothetical protein
VKQIKWHYIFSLAIVLIAASCGLKKELAYKENLYDGLSEKKFNQLLESSSPELFSTLEIARFNASYSSLKETKNFKGYIRLQKDSVFMLSVSPLLGIELFRLRATNDSVGYIDRYYKSYSINDLSFFERKYRIPGNFDVLQSILLASNNTLSSSTPDRKVFSETKEFYRYDYFFDEDNSRYSIEFFYSKSLKLNRILLTDFSNNSTVSVDYKSYFNEPGLQNIPQFLRITLVQSKTMATLELDFKKAELNKTLNFPFTISDNYTRID